MKISWWYVDNIIGTRSKSPHVYKVSLSLLSGALDNPPSFLRPLFRHLLCVIFLPGCTTVIRLLSLLIPLRYHPLNYTCFVCLEFAYFCVNFSFKCNYSVVQVCIFLAIVLQIYSDSLKISGIDVLYTL